MRIEAFMFLVDCTKLELVRLYQSPACSNWQRARIFHSQGALIIVICIIIIIIAIIIITISIIVIIVMNITITIVINKSQPALIDSGLAYFTPWLLFGLGWRTIRGWGNRLIRIYQWFCVFCHAVWAHCNVHILRVYEIVNCTYPLGQYARRYAKKKNKGPIILQICVLRINVLDLQDASFP